MSDELTDEQIEIERLRYANNQLTDMARQNAEVVEGLFREVHRWAGHKNSALLEPQQMGFAVDTKLILAKLEDVKMATVEDVLEQEGFFMPTIEVDMYHFTLKLEQIPGDYKLAIHAFFQNERGVVYSVSRDLLKASRFPTLMIKEITNQIVRRLEGVQ